MLLLLCYRTNWLSSLFCIFIPTQTNNVPLLSVHLCPFLSRSLDISRATRRHAVSLLLASLWKLVAQIKRSRSLHHLTSRQNRIGKSSSVVIKGGLFLFLRQSASTKRERKTEWKSETSRRPHPEFNWSSQSGNLRTISHALVPYSERASSYKIYTIVYCLAFKVKNKTKRTEGKTPGLFGVIDDITHDREKEELWVEKKRKEREYGLRSFAFPEKRNR